MTQPPILFFVFGLLYAILFFVRNIYYFKLWINRRKFDTEEQRAKVFGPGIQKFMFSITLDEKASDPLVNKTITMVNIFNYLQFLSFILAAIFFFYN